MTTPPQGWGPPPQGWGPPPQGSGPLPQAWGQPPPGWGTGQAWGPPPEAPEPGVIPLRPLSVGDVLEATLRTLRRHLAATLGSSALLVVVVTAVEITVLLPVLRALAALPDPPGDQASLAAWFDALEAFPWQRALVGGALVGLLSAALLALLSGVMSVVVGQAVLGRPCSLGQAWSTALPRLPVLLVTALLVGLATAGIWLVGVLLVLALATGGLVPGWLVALVALLLVVVALLLTLFVTVRLSLSTPAVMLESDHGSPIGPVRALRRSWSLVGGAWWRTFGIVLLGAVIAAALSSAVSVPVQVVVGAVPVSLGVSLAATLVGGALGQALTLPIVGVVLALVYVDRRIRIEALDDALARAAGLGPLRPGGQ